MYKYSKDILYIINIKLRLNIMDKPKRKSKERKKMESRILTEISNCEKEDKKHLLNMIAVNLGEESLHESNDGVGVYIDIIDDVLLKEIDEFIFKAIKKTEIDLDSE